MWHFHNVSPDGTKLHHKSTGFYRGTHSRAVGTRFFPTSFFPACEEEQSSAAKPTENKWKAHKKANPFQSGKLINEFLFQTGSNQLHQPHHQTVPHEDVEWDFTPGCVSREGMKAGIFLFVFKFFLADVGQVFVLLTNWSLKNDRFTGNKLFSKF